MPRRTFPHFVPKLVSHRRARHRRTRSCEGCTRAVGRVSVGGGAAAACRGLASWFSNRRYDRVALRWSILRLSLRPARSARRSEQARDWLGGRVFPHCHPRSQVSISSSLLV